MSNKDRRDETGVGTPDEAGRPLEKVVDSQQIIGDQQREESVSRDRPNPYETDESGESSEDTS